MSKASNQLQEVQHISASNPDDEGPGSPDNRRLLLGVHPTTWTTLRRPTGSSSQLHEIPPVTNLGAPDCHLWRIWHLVTWDRSLSQLPTPLCSFQWFTHILFLLDTSWLRRPLCALPNDSHLSYLSPGHFLIGEPLTQLPTIDYSNIKMSRLSRWQQKQQQQLQNYWKGWWSTDYLHELQHRQRWHRSSHNIQPGDPVFLREDNTAPFHWPTAVITDVHPGADGNTSGHNQEPQRDSYTPHFKNLPPSAC